MVAYSISTSTLSGSIIAPSSKSHSLRAVLFASMASGKSTIYACLQSPDVEAMIAACKKIGAQIKRTNNTIEIVGVAGKPSVPDDVIDAGNSGQVLRFIGSIVALIDGYTVITGDHSVRFNRPVRSLITGLTQLGAFCQSTKGDGYAPLIIKGPIDSGKIMIDGQDSQPVSGLLMASAFLNGCTEIYVSNAGEKPWIGVTLDWFDRLGINYCNKNFEYYKVEGGNVINGFNYSVPGDFSSILFPVVAALITQSDITIDNIDMNDSQGDKKVIAQLQEMGADISLCEKKLLIKAGRQLHGCEIDVNDFIDALPILSVLACYVTGTTVLKNAGIARQKESDRLAVITSELQKMGADIVEREDMLIIQGKKLVGGDVQTYDDHRIAMSLAVAAFGAKEKTIVDNVHCVKKSYHNFYQDMRSLGCAIEVIE